HEVQQRSEYVSSAYQQYNAGSLLDHALNSLNAAQAPQDPASLAFLDRLLEANSEDDIPRGYLAQAEILLRASAPDRAAIQAALSEAETRARRGPMPLFLAEAYLLRARMELLVGRTFLSGHPSAESGPEKNVRPTAQDLYELAQALIKKHGYRRLLPDLAVLQCEMDPSLEKFQTACAQVGEEGWWHLMGRLEALATAMDAAAPKTGLLRNKKSNVAEQLLVPLRKKEAAYHAERDAYLAEVEKEQERLQAEASKQPAKANAPGVEVTDALVEQVFANEEAHPVLRQVLDASDIPSADLDAVPMEIKRQVVAFLVKNAQS
ncbi:MAG: hypothetical protein AAF191_17980, partial [Verrucomicrobiota bacterium]